MRSLSHAISVVVAALLSTLVAANASASTIPIGVASFAGSTLTTFAGLADGTDVSGLIVDGIQFQYSLGKGQVVIDGGPGVTNNVSPQDVLSVGNNTGVLTLLLPSSVNRFGYGYALLNTSPVANATSISVFDGAMLLGNQSYNAVLDPFFTGGFAGIQSTDAFNRVEIRFNSNGIPAFALDNVRMLSTDVVPEPATLLLLGSGVFGLLRTRVRHTAD